MLCTHVYTQLYTACRAGLSPRFKSAKFSKFPLSFSPVDPTNAFGSASGELALLLSFFPCIREPSFGTIAGHTLCRSISTDSIRVQSAQSATSTTRKPKLHSHSGDKRPLLHFHPLSDHLPNRELSRAITTRAP